MEAKLQQHTSDEPSKLPYQFIKQITNDFDEERILGSGGFGTVYKGVHESRGEIAVKVLHTISGLDDKEFHKEFNNLRGLKHQNIVELVGFCKESEEELAEFDGKQVTATRIHMALCFEYVHKGSLNELISDENKGFNWPTRYRIIKGICEGLKYLRERLEYPIMHFDLKPGNILLDKDMVPKIADFGLSKLFGEENTRKTMSSIGTCGYWPPEYVKHQIISKEFDIFSLGVIIVKIMTGHEGYNHVVEMTTRKSVKLVHKNWRKRLLQSRTPLLEVYCNQVKRCIEIALDCLKLNRQERPTIQDIVSSLNETERMIGDQGLQIEKFNQEDHEESIPRSMSSRITFGPSSGRGEAIRLMMFEEIIRLTNGFSEERLLAVGRNGKVYKGICEDGQVLAVKVLSSTPGHQIFERWSKYSRMRRFKNQNIVSLVGYSYGKQSKLVEHKKGRYVYADEMQRILCFEYLPNGSLERHISDVHSGLDWHTRYGIIKGTCVGLRHLHHAFPFPSYHLNIKPSKILLDENMQPKIDDIICNDVTLLRMFGRRPHMPQGKVGSIEYMPPEFVEKQIISEKYNIYSMGIVIIEIMTGNKYRLGSLEMSSKEFIDRVCVSWRKRLQETVMLTSVEGYCQQVKKCLEIALKCMEANRHRRPTIENIVNMLNKTETLIHSEPLLDVHPLELCFLPFIKKKAMISCSLWLDNKGNDRVAFMLVANSPKRYLTKKPLCGVVPPRCAYTLTLTVMPNKKQPAPSSFLSSESGGDFFMLYSVVLEKYDLLDVDKDHVAIEYNKFFKTAGEEVQEVTLKVISCSDGLAPVDEETSSSSEPTRQMVEIITTPDAQQVSSIDMHPTEPWIITTHHVGSLRVWNCQTMAMLNSIQDVTGEPVHSAKFIAREKWVVAGDGNGCIHVYSYDQNQCVESFDAHDGCITTLAVHPTDPFVLSSSSDDDDHLIKLWDWNKDWKCTRTFQGHTDKVTQVTFNPKNKDSFASTSWDGTVKIWSICSNDTSSIITLKLDEHGLCVDYFTRYNREHLIVGCKDRTAQIWELGMKECVDNLEGHADRISAVKLHPELPILITASLDGTVRIWNSTTYKLENIIGFNLGAVYAFGCIEGTRRIVVGCHQGVATMEIYSP